MAAIRQTWLFAVMMVLAAGSTQNQAVASAANPIRKVVMLLQNMQKQVTKEGEEQQAAYDKFMCYCSTGTNDLEKSIETGKAKIDSLTSALKAASEQKGATEQDLKEHQTSRSEAKEAMASATAIREKEAGIYAKFKSDHDTNLEALSKATKAIETGVMGAFVQTKSANTLKSFLMEKAEISDAARQELLVFLSGSQEQGYVPQSGEIIGILKQMHDEMSEDLSQATTAENAAIASYEALMAAKTKEVNTLIAQIETEMTRIGELGVEIATMENDLEDTQEALAEDTKYLAELGGSCKTKTEEWEVIKKTRAEELLALAETIKVLNDDDALELFKKTLPSASASFVQVKVDASFLRDRALAVLHKKLPKTAHMEIDFIALALQGKQMGFEKVIVMIDEMVTNLKKEQGGDDSKKAYCEESLDASEDKKKQLELAVSDSETTISELKGSIATLSEEMAALEDGIKALDKSVAEATEMRQTEHSEYNELVTSDTNAKEVLLWAKNRLNKFYNSKLYKAPPKRELTEEQDITVRMGGTLAPTAPPGGIAGTGIGAASLAQVAAHRHRGARAAAAPGPAPETFGAYAAKNAESTGVISMIDLLVKDLDKELQEAGVSERDAQADYETMMAEASNKRAEDSKSLTGKTAAKAQAEEMLQAEESTKSDTTKVLMQTEEFIKDLHIECDWLLKYFSMRKEARDNEIDALGQAKAVLSGADYSLLQTARLRR